MKRNSIVKNEINTDADSNLKGIDLQKLRATERLLSALLNKKKCIYCTIEYIDDVIEIDFSNDRSKIQTEQNKNYGKCFSINSKEVKNSLRIFFDTWRKAEESESITFVFYTNTGIAKEKCIGELKNVGRKLPSDPFIKLLIEKRYDEVLPFIIPVIKSYYIEQHKKHSIDNSYYEDVIEDIKYDEWKTFFELIEWRFNEPNEMEIRDKIQILIMELCKEYNVEVRYSDKILASILDMISSRALETDFLNKLVHVSDVKLMFYDFVREVKVDEKLDPVHTRWDELKCNDVRDLGEKIFSVCPDFDEDILLEYEDDFIEGKFEQDNYIEIKEVKAYNYRIYKVCNKYVKKLLKDKNDIAFSEEHIVEIIKELTCEGEKSILDKSKTYKIPYKDRDMVYKTVLILFQECFIALD